MEQKKASIILIQLSNKSELSVEEKEAPFTAIGILAWTGLAKSRVRSLKAGKDKDMEWK